VDAVQPLVDAVQPLVDAVQPLVDAVQPLVDAVQPVLEEGLAPLTTNPQVQAVAASTAWLGRLWEDSRLWWLAGGLLVGGYFGYRVGGVSARAERWAASRRFMRGVGVASYTGAKAVTLQTVEVPETVGDCEVLVEVRAASLDPVDLKVCQGYGRGLRELVNRYNPNVNKSQFPVILGRDGTGLVSEVGSAVAGLRVGDRVWFVVPHCVQGALTKYIVLDSQYVRPLPARLSFEGGATLPYTGMAAWNMLVTAGGLGPGEGSCGQAVLVWGGVRALERLTVQLLVAWGCRVTCVAPLYTHEYLASLGASTLIPEDMAEVGRLAAAGTRFQVVVNTSGLLAEELCLALTSPGGRVVTTLVQPPGLREYGLVSGLAAGVLAAAVGLLRDNLWGGDRAWSSTVLQGEVLDYLATLVTKGALEPVGERIYSLDQAEIAFRELAAGGHKGKLVIRMEEEQVTTTQLALC